MISGEKENWIRDASPHSSAAADNDLEALKQQLHLLHLPDANGKTALDEKYQALVLVTYLLTRLADPVAAQEFQALLSHADYRVEKMARQLQKGHPALYHDHGQPQEPHDQETLAMIQRLLRHSRAELRELGLEWAVEEPDQRLAPDILPNLGGRSEELLPLASRAFRIRCTHDQQTRRRHPRAGQEEQGQGPEGIRHPPLRRPGPDVSPRLSEHPGLPARLSGRSKSKVKARAQYHLPVLPRSPGAAAAPAKPDRNRARSPQNSRSLRPQSFPQPGPQATLPQPSAEPGLQPHINQADLPALQECRDRWK